MRQKREIDSWGGMDNKVSKKRVLSTGYELFTPASIMDQ